MKISSAKIIFMMKATPSINQLPTKFGNFNIVISSTVETISYFPSSDLFTKNPTNP